MRHAALFFCSTVSLGLLMAAANSTAQQSGGGYVMRKFAVAGGGSCAAGGPYRLVGTLGQTSAAVIAGGNYRLTVGFHAADRDRVFANAFDHPKCN